MQLLCAQREELRTGNGLQHVEQQLPGLAGVLVGHRQGVVHAPGDQRDLEDVGIHRSHGEQPDEAVLGGQGPAVAGPLLTHDHDVGVGAVAQVAGNRCLRRDQQLVIVGELGQVLVAQLQDAQSAVLLDRRPALTHRAGLVTEKHEVPVGQPAQQVGNVASVRAGKWVPESASSASAKPISRAFMAAESTVT